MFFTSPSHACLAPGSLFYPQPLIPVKNLYVTLATPSLPYPEASTPLGPTGFVCWMTTSLYSSASSSSELLYSFTAGLAVTRFSSDCPTLTHTHSSHQRLFRLSWFYYGPDASFSLHCSLRPSLVISALCVPSVPQNHQVMPSLMSSTSLGSSYP